MTDPSELNMEKESERSHRRAQLTTVCRWSFAAVVAVTAVIGFRWNPTDKRIREAEIAHARALVFQAAAEAALAECKRWTP